MFYPQTKSGQISKLRPHYNAEINNDVQVLKTKLYEVLAIPDWRRHTPKNIMDETDLLVCLANWV